MFTPILIATLAAAQIPAPTQTPNQPRAIIAGPISNTKIVNAIANPGFESGMGSWSSEESFVDPNWYGDPAQYEPLYGEGTTSYVKHGGSRGYQFGLTPEYGLGGAYAVSQIYQNLAPVNANSVTSAFFYAWANASSWSPQTVGVKIEYADATPSTYYQDITGDGYYYGPQPSDWQKVDFKSALKPGKTIIRITIATERYPYEGSNLYVDDVTVNKKVPIVVLP